MKDMVTKLTERGQISIPARIRKDMHLLPGAKLHWEEISEYECRLVVDTSVHGKGARAMRGYAKTFRKPRRTSEWMQELREGEE